MSIGAVLERKQRAEQPARPVPVPLQERYDRTLAEVRRLGEWLEGPQGRALAPTAWEAEFRRYRRTQARLRRLGEELRPSTLRDRREVLTGAALVAEAAELFA